MAAIRRRQLPLSSVQENQLENETDEDYEVDDTIKDEDESTSEHAAETAVALSSSSRQPPAAISRLPLKSRVFTSSAEDSLETARTLEAARAARLLPPQEKQARARSLEDLKSMTSEERAIMYKRVHAVKKKIQSQLSASLQRLESDPETPRPKTPREIEDYFDVVGPKILQDVVAAEKRALEVARQEKALVAQLKAKKSGEDRSAAAQSPAKQKKSALFRKLGLSR